MEAIEVVGYILAWLIESPLLTLAYLFLLLAAWGPFLGGLGITDLFWHRRKPLRFATGLATGCVVGLLVHIRYLVPTSMRQPVWLDRVCEVPSMLWWFEDRNPALHEFGEYLTAVFTLAVVALLLPALRNLRQRWAMGLGLILAIPLYIGTARLADDLGAIESMARSATVGRSVTDKTVEASLPSRELARAERATDMATMKSNRQARIVQQRDVFYLSSLLSIPFVVASLSLLAWVRILREPPPPMLSLVCLMAIVESAYAHVVPLVSGSQYILAVGSIVWASLASRSPLKIRLPGMEPLYRKSRLRDIDAPPFARPEPELILGRTILAAGEARWTALRATRPNLPEKPLLVLMAASGGGVRSAVFTCAILEYLRIHRPLLSEQMRLITGASGGMVGASLYASWQAKYEGRYPNGVVPGQIEVNPATGTTDPIRTPLAWAMGRDAMSRLFSTMLFNDIPAVLRPSAKWLPWMKYYDRGRSLERAWTFNTAPDGLPSPLALPLSSLAVAESQALAPSLIFSPMLVEDARRLFISNLDLEKLCSTEGPTPGVASVSAAEFFRIFPEQHETFRISTAARLNATFPFFSPAVFLPTNPPRRVVDAGYYDNYGIDVAAEWVYHHADEIREHCSGVLILEVRAYANREDRMKWLPYDDGGPFRFLTSPFSGMMAMQERSPWYRNDERLRGLGSLFENRFGVTNFVRSQTLEFDGDAPLGWSMTDEQRLGAIASAESEVIKLLRRLQEHYRWLV